MARRDQINQDYNFYAASKKPTVAEIESKLGKTKCTHKETLPPRRKLEQKVDWAKLLEQKKHMMDFGNRPMGMTIRNDPPSEPRIFQVSRQTITVLMRSFTYKPNWEFRVVPNWSGSFSRGAGESEVGITVRFWVENSVGQHRPWAVEQETYRDGYFDYDYEHDVKRYMPMRPRYRMPQREVLPVEGTWIVPLKLRTEQEFWDWLREVAISSAEDHERDEWFKINGRPPFDPHRPDRVQAERQRALAYLL